MGSIRDKEASAACNLAAGLLSVVSGKMHSRGDERLHTILVVEDVEAVRKLICAMLTHSGYNCVEAADGVDALRIFNEAPLALDLVVTDMIMPEMGGAELKREVARVRPGLPFIFISGFTEDPVVQDVERSRGLFLAKPFTAAALLDKVRNALGPDWSGASKSLFRSAP